jgi:hypothetical protein
MSYTNVFTGSTIYPSEISLTKLDLTANVILYWPLEAPEDEPLASRIVEITSSTSAAWTVRLPDAMLVSVGQTILFNNRTAFAINVINFSGTVIVSLAANTQWQIYLATNTTQAGVWRQYQFGAATSTANAAALAGHGLRATGAELETAVIVENYTTNTTLTEADHASFINWEGAGTGTITLPSTVSLSTAWYVYIRNTGGGALTVDTTGPALINESATLVFAPGDSALIAHDNTNYFTVGFGQNAVFAFDYVVVNVTGSSNYVLIGNELNRVAYQFIGAMGANFTVIVPSTTQQYWVYNNTTGGRTLSIGTAGQVSPLVLTPGLRTIVYSDGTNVVPAVTSFVTGTISGGTF